MVHSLMARGVSFDDAYRTANQIRQLIGNRRVVERAEIAKAVRDSQLGKGTGPAQDTANRLPSGDQVWDPNIGSRERSVFPSRLIT